MPSNTQPLVRDYRLAKALPEAARAAKAPTLRVRGNTRLIGQSAIGVCGSRDATDLAVERAHRCGVLATEMGFGVVSGNARGVDEAAQRGALESHGWSVAVLAEGLRDWRPRVKHRPLISAENFLAVSSYEDGHHWTSWRAMARNKLIVALSQVLVVVQAGTKGGTWDAGIECLRSNKPLLVVHGQSDSSETEGNRELIRRGGISVTTFNELCEILSRMKADPTKYAPQAKLPLK